MTSKDGIKQNYKKSAFFQNREQRILKSLNETTNPKQRKTIENKMHLLKPPELIDDAFTRIPNQILDTIYNSKEFDSYEINLILYIMRQTLGFQKHQTQYKGKKIMESLNMKKTIFYKSLKSLIDKNVINKMKSEVDDKKRKIYTDHKIVFNMFGDTGDIELNKEELVEKETDISKESLTQEIETL